MNIGGKQITTGEGIIGRIRDGILRGRAAADIGRGAVPEYKAIIREVWDGSTIGTGSG